MLEKYGIFKDENNIFKTIFKNDKGYIDITHWLEGNSISIIVPYIYDLEIKNIILIDDLLFLIKESLKDYKIKETLKIYIKDFNNEITKEFINELETKAKLTLEYSNIEIITENIPINSELNSEFIDNLLHTKNHNIEEDNKFTEWKNKYKIINKQRKDYLSWDEYFMAIAKLSALRSKDPNTQVGACIVSKDNRIISVGYNGAPTGYSDSRFPWDREGSNLETKYFFVIHAERNAILNYKGSSRDFIDSKIYVDLFPCNECAKEIIQAGIKEVIYLSDKYKDTESTIASKVLLDECGVKYRQLNVESADKITIDLLNYN